MIPPLFQIWLNLPRADKMVEPYFSMLWSHTIPEHAFRNDGGRETRVVTVAGALDGKWRTGRTRASPCSDQRTPQFKT